MHDIGDMNFFSFLTFIGNQRFGSKGYFNWNILKDIRLLTLAIKFAVVSIAFLDIINATDDMLAIYIILFLVN